MTTETIETTPSEPVAAPEQVEEQTESPAEPIEAEPEAAAAPDDAAAAQQVTAEPPGITRDEVERLIEERATRIREDEREQERRRRQIENSRRDRVERERIEAQQEAIDTLKAALGARGVYELPDDAAMAAISRITQKQAARIQQNQLDMIDDAMEWIAAPLFNNGNAELPEHAQEAAQRLSPKVQKVIDAVRPVIEKQSREGYVKESDIPKLVEAEIARRAAKGREGKEELQRVDGSAPSTIDRSLEAITDRIISNSYDAEDEKIWRERFQR